MRNLLLPALALVLGQSLSAHELDAREIFPNEQIQLSRDLPQTAVVRVRKADPSSAEIVQVRDKIPPGEIRNGLKFAKIALLADAGSGLVMTQKNELDTTSSTASWGFGYYSPFGCYTYLGCAGNGIAYRQPEMAVWVDNWDQAQLAPPSAMINYRWQSPVYQYGGYAFQYQPYWAYQDADYNYYYSGWNY